MGIKVHTNISDEFDDIEVIINAPALTNEVQIITNNVTRMSSEINEIIGYKGNEIFLLPINEVCYIYSEEKNNFCKSDKGSSNCIHYSGDTSSGARFRNILHSVLFHKRQYRIRY